MESTESIYQPTNQPTYGIDLPFLGIFLEGCFAPPFVQAALFVPPADFAAAALGADFAFGAAPFKTETIADSDAMDSGLMLFIVLHY